MLFKKIVSLHPTQKHINMTRGRKVCNVLKEIRKEIAARNEIEYVTSECTVEAECSGTCPKCESEVKYLENELNKRRRLGKAVAVAGISLGIAVIAPACANSEIVLDGFCSVVEDTMLIENTSVRVGRIMEEGDTILIEPQLQKSIDFIPPDI